METLLCRLHPSSARTVIAAYTGQGRNFFPFFIGGQTRTDFPYIFDSLEGATKGKGAPRAHLGLLFGALGGWFCFGFNWGIRAQSDVDPDQRPGLGHGPYWAHLEPISIEAEWPGLVCQVKSKKFPERASARF